MVNIGNSVGKTYKIKWVYLEGAKELNNTEVETTESAVQEQK